MKERGLRAIQPKQFVPQTIDSRADKPSDNLLEGHPLPKAPNMVFAGDITYIRTESGWLYLALSEQMRADLVVRALEQALASTPKMPGRIFHSDRGSQYESKVFRKLLKKLGCDKACRLGQTPITTLGRNQ